jgi:DNA-binding XRE family transcriptional regulator
MMTAADLQEARRMLGMSQTELAKHLDVNHMTVSRWERGLWPVPKLVSRYLTLLLDTL